MTAIQQVLWELRMDYIGHPYYVSGNAILHALGQHLESETHAAVSASHSVFVPGQFGTFPEEHTQSGIRPYLGSGLPDVEAYDDLFLQREAMHPWLLDTRARDALNTHDLRVHGGHPALAHETIMGRRKNSGSNSRRRNGTFTPTCTPMTRRFSRSARMCWRISSSAASATTATARSS
jgi:hypothetical protein